MFDERWFLLIQTAADILIKPLSFHPVFCFRSGLVIHLCILAESLTLVEMCVSRGRLFIRRSDFSPDTYFHSGSLASVSTPAMDRKCKTSHWANWQQSRYGCKRYLVSAVFVFWTKWLQPLSCSYFYVSMAVIVRRD